MPKVRTIGDYAFMKCESLTEIEMPDDVKTGYMAFYMTPLEDKFN